MIPTVLIPGLKGSTLVDATGEIKWLTMPQALGLSNPRLNLPLEWRAGRQVTDKLRAVDVLRSLKLGPIRRHNYAGILDAFATAEVPMETFAYDWRRESFENVAAFERFLEGRRFHFGQPLNVVAHSLGGLIAFVVWKRRPELFNELIIAGAPFKGSSGFLPDLTTGHRNGLNRRILAPLVLGTFPSCYAFFPRNSALDFYTVGTWEKNRWSLFLPAFKGDAEMRREFFRHALMQAEKFRDEVEAETWHLGSKLTVIVGTKLPTLTDALQKTYRPGDGRVSAEFAVPNTPRGFTQINSQASHEELLNDPKVLRSILRRIQQHR